MFMMCRKMADVEMKGGAVVPESFLKKQKRQEEWDLAKKTEIEAKKKKNAENRKIIFNRAKSYEQEYKEQVQMILLLLFGMLSMSP